MTQPRRTRRDLLAISLSSESHDEFGLTADEIIRRATAEFAEEMSQIMGSPATVQVGGRPPQKAARPMQQQRR